MSTTMNDTLRGIIERHGTMLVDDVRRCEACIREAPLAKPEIAGLVAALREGLPKQLLRLPAGTLSRSGMTALAAQLAQNGGLDAALAQRAVEAWAFALRLSPAADPEPGEPTMAQAEPRRDPPKVRPQPRKTPAAPRPIRTGQGPFSRGGLVLGLIALVVLMIGVAGLAIGELTRKIPWSCGDYSSMAPSECHRNVAIYIAGFVLLCGAVGALWRKLRR